MTISSFTEKKLDALNLSAQDYFWVIDQLEALQIAFDNPPWVHANPDDLHTQAQVGYLSHVMDLERHERIEVLEIILGRQLHWDVSQDFPGSVPEEDMEEPENYPGPSLKDIGITKWMTSHLIDYYLNGDGLELNKKLGYTSKTSTDQAKRITRQVAQAAKANATGTAPQKP